MSAQHQYRQRAFDNDILGVRAKYEFFGTVAPFHHHDDHATAQFFSLFHVGIVLQLKAQYRLEGQTVIAAGAKSAVGSAYAQGAEYTLSKRTGFFPALR
nr:hypothetical protein [Rhodoferax sp.]